MEHGVAGAAGGRRDNAFLEHDGLMAGNPILACTPKIADRWASRWRGPATRLPLFRRRGDRHARRCEPWN
jgi:hypothetical protein